MLVLSDITVLIQSILGCHQLAFFPFAEFAGCRSSRRLSLGGACAEADVACFLRAVTMYIKPNIPPLNGIARKAASTQHHNYIG